MNIKTKGFTLIELLVVIAIIGILSSVVLAGINGSINKSSIVASKKSLVEASSQAELYYGVNTANPNSYIDVCINIKQNVEAAIKSSAVKTDIITTNCTSDDNEWVAYVTLKNNEGKFCVDHKNYSGITTKDVNNYIAANEAGDHAWADGYIDCLSITSVPMP